jgi:hypothetical protein
VGEIAQIKDENLRLYVEVDEGAQSQTGIKKVKPYNQQNII